jgi:hypothetical protein
VLICSDSALGGVTRDSHSSSVERLDKTEKMEQMEQVAEELEQNHLRGAI